MKIRTSKFRLQLQAIRDLGIPVIPITDFQAWKRGEKFIDTLAEGIQLPQKAAKRLAGRAVR